MTGEGNNRPRRADRAESDLIRLRDAASRWLYVGEALILAAVAIVLLIGGVLILADAGRGIVDAISARPIAETVFGIAESALLALILAELVHSLVVTLDGGSLTPGPFLVIAIVAILRKMLLATVLVQPSDTGGQLITPPVVELVVLSVVILILSISLAITGSHWGRRARVETPLGEADPQAS